MQFRNQGESAHPARFHRASGPLLAFVAFSLLVHASGFLFPTASIEPLSESRYGSTMIRAVLAPVGNTPAATSVSRKQTSPPIKESTSKPTRAASIIHRHDESATTMAKTSSTEIPQPVQQKPLVMAEKKPSAVKTFLENAPQKSAQSSRDESANEQHHKQQEQQRNYLLGEIQSRLARYLSYPLRARKRGWQGEVMLAFRINTSGQLRNIRLSKSSGYSLLDRSALNAIAKLKQIAVPDKLGRPQTMTLQLPVQFKLYEG